MARLIQLKGDRIWQESENLRKEREGKRGIIPVGSEENVSFDLFKTIDLVFPPELRILQALGLRKS